MKVKLNSLLVKCFTSAVIYYVPQDIIIGSLIASNHYSRNTGITGRFNNEVTSVEEVASQMNLSANQIVAKRKLNFIKYELI